ncbi:TetR family transcriptional regulator C-terminal domain-containing protein, partial [Acinetobacter baumannii]
SDQSEVLRKELVVVMRKWRDMFAACIESGQNNGEITKKHSAVDLAELFLSGWNGAILRMKTLKSTEPLEVFVSLMVDDMLKP